MQARPRWCLAPTAGAALPKPPAAGLLWPPPLLLLCSAFPAESFHAEATLAAVQAERCTSLYGVPTMFISLLALPRWVLPRACPHMVACRVPAQACSVASASDAASTPVPGRPGGKRLMAVSLLACLAAPAPQLPAVPAGLAAYRRDGGVHLPSGGDEEGGDGVMKKAGTGCRAGGATHGPAGLAQAWQQARADGQR